MKDGQISHAGKFLIVICLLTLTIIWMAQNNFSKNVELQSKTIEIMALTTEYNTLNSQYSNIMERIKDLNLDKSHVCLPVAEEE